MKNIQILENFRKNLSNYQKYFENKKHISFPIYKKYFPFKFRHELGTQYLYRIPQVELITYR